MTDDSLTDPSGPPDIRVDPFLTMAAGSFLDRSAAELLDVCAATDGLRGFGLRLTGEHHLDPDQRVALGETAAARRLEIFDVEVLRIGSELGPYISSVEELIEAAAALRARHVLVVGDTKDRDRLRRELAHVVSVAAEHGIVVGLEYMAWTTPSFVDEARSLAEATGCRLVVDLLHHTRIGATATDLARIVADGSLGWVQICDAGPPTDQLVHEARHRRRAPGRGVLPLAELLAVVPRTTPFSIEVQSDELRSVEPIERAQLLTSAADAILRNAFSR
ncbi:MAG: sugar phosphate isomerase/epimerase family protein [Actinomycetota bacterium]